MFIKRLNALIAQKKTTKNKVLTDLKLGKNSFNNWETRGNIPDGETLIKLAAYFEVSIDYLLGVPMLSRDYSISPEQKDLFDLITALTEDEVKQAADYLDFIIS